MTDDERERLATNIRMAAALTAIDGNLVMAENLTASATQLRADGERIKALEAERDRLRDGIQAFLNGDVERPVKSVFRADGKPSKHDLCPQYEGCEGCADVYFEAMLRLIPRRRKK